MIRMLMLTMLVAAPALAQEAPAGDPPKRVRSVLLYGDQACPKPETADEIVVCANAGDSIYRIPKALRERTPGPEGTSWTRRAEVVDEVNRAVLPGSCTPIGSYGQSGCTLQFIQRWAAEKQDKQRREAGIP